MAQADAGVGGGYGVGLAAIQSPAATVAFTDSKMVGSSAGWYSSFDVDSPAALWAPDCYTWSNGGWGVGSYGDTINYAANPTGTGQVAVRHTQGTNVSFVDGHAKWYTPGGLAVGTNWNKTMSSGAIQITDRSAYLWDLQ